VAVETRGFHANASPPHTHSAELAEFSPSIVDSTLLCRRGGRRLMQTGTTWGRQGTGQFLRDNHLTR
jgi:hypothetical protein